MAILIAAVSDQPIVRTVTHSAATRPCAWGIRAEGDSSISSFNRGVVFFGVAMAVVLGGTAPSAAEVDLEWRAASRLLQVGEVVEVALYAVSSDGTDQPFAGLDAVIGWDPGVLELIGKVDNGPYFWAASWFPNDEGVDGLNADCATDRFCDPYTWLPYSDGDALYGAFALNLDAPPVATAEGLLVTTLLFLPLDRADLTDVRFLVSAGDSSATRVVAVYEGETQVITGALTGLTFSIEACGVRGDFDGDCVVSLADVAEFTQCMAGPDEPVADAGCQAADTGGLGDGDADLRDFAAIQWLFSGP